MKIEIRYQRTSDEKVFTEDLDLSAESTKKLLEGAGAFVATKNTEEANYVLLSIRALNAPLPKRPFPPRASLYLN